MANRKRRARTPIRFRDHDGDEDWHRESTSPTSARNTRSPSAIRSPSLNATLPPAAFPTLDEPVPPSSEPNEDFQQPGELSALSIPYVSSAESSEDEASLSMAMSITGLGPEVCLLECTDRALANEGRQHNNHAQSCVSAWDALSPTMQLSMVDDLAAQTGSLSVAFDQLNLNATQKQRYESKKAIRTKEQEEEDAMLRELRMETHFSLLNNSPMVAQTYSDRLNKAVETLANKRALTEPLVSSKDLRQAATIASCKAVSPRKLSSWYALRPGRSSSPATRSTAHPRASQSKESSSQGLEVEYDLVARRGREADDYVAGVGRDSPVELATRASTRPITIKLKNSPLQRTKDAEKPQGSRRKFIPGPRKSGLSRTTLARDVTLSPLPLHAEGNESADGWAYAVSHSGTKLVKSPTSDRFIEVKDEGRHEPDPVSSPGNQKQSKAPCARPLMGTFSPQNLSISTWNGGENPSIPTSIPRYKLNSPKADPRAPRAPVARMAPRFASSDDRKSEPLAPYRGQAPAAAPGPPQPMVAPQPVSDKEAVAFERQWLASMRHQRPSTDHQKPDVLQLAQKVLKETKAPESPAAARYEVQTTSQYLQPRRDAVVATEPPAPTWVKNVNVSRLTQELHEAAGGPAAENEVSLDAPPSSETWAELNEGGDEDTIVVTPRLGNGVREPSTVSVVENGDITNGFSPAAGSPTPRSVAPLDTLKSHRPSTTSRDDLEGDFDTISASSGPAAAETQPNLTKETSVETRMSDWRDEGPATVHDETQIAPTSAAWGDATALKRKKGPDSPEKNHKPSTRGRKTYQSGVRRSAGRRTLDAVEKSQDALFKTPQKSSTDATVRGGAKSRGTPKSPEEARETMSVTRGRRSETAKRTPQRLRVLRGEK